MGGFGSGKHGGKRCTNDMLALDVRSINRAGRLTPGSWFTWQWTCNAEKTASIQLRVAADSVVLDYRRRGRSGGPARRDQEIGHSRAGRRVIRPWKRPVREEPAFRF